MNQATTALLNFFNLISESNFNKKSLANGWSPGDVAEHILLLETQVNKALGRAHKTERQPDLKSEPVRLGLADLEKKFVAPDFILPSPGEKIKQHLIDGITEQRSILQHFIETTDLAETVDYKHPVIGSMTRYEWSNFIVHHAQRHLSQMQQQLF